MYTKPTNFEVKLVEEAELVGLSKMDCDLFFILQANTITYQQLEMTGIHGITEAGGRLSLKRLEKGGYVYSKTLPVLNGTKYCILSSRGKDRLKRLFPSSFLARLHVDFDKCPPSSQQQLPHRIRTNDLYYAYASCPYAKPFLWELEKRLVDGSSGSPSPRCDAFLDTGHAKYYVEQDNSTQSEAVLERKLRGYLDTGIFNGNGSEPTRLLFTVACEIKNRPVNKPSYSIYRTLLKGTKLWSALEEKTETSITFTELLRLSDTEPIANLMLTPTEKSLLKNLERKHEGLHTLTNALDLKRAYLYDTEYACERNGEKDFLFKKRLYSKFHSTVERVPEIQRLFRKGMCFYVIPNHRMKEYLPFVLPREYHMSETFLKAFFYMGLLNIGSWSFQYSKRLCDTDGRPYYFSNVFFNENKSFLAMEDVVHDLGSSNRVRYFLKTHSFKCHVLLVLLVEDSDDACRIHKTLSDSLRRRENRNISICFMDEGPSIFGDSSSSPYLVRDNPNKEVVPVVIDYEEYSGEFNLMERR